MMIMMLQKIVIGVTDTSTFDPQMIENNEARLVAQQVSRRSLP